MSEEIIRVSYDYDVNIKRLENEEQMNEQEKVRAIRSFVENGKKLIALAAKQIEQQKTALSTSPSISFERNILTTGIGM